MPLPRAVPRADRAGRGGSAESGARRARAAATPTAALGRLCVHRSDVLGALSRAEVDSEHRLRGLALEGVRGPGESRAQTHFDARHGPHLNARHVRAAPDDGRGAASWPERARAGLRGRPRRPGGVGGMEVSSGRGVIALGASGAAVRARGALGIARITKVNHPNRVNHRKSGNHMNESPEITSPESPKNHQPLPADYSPDSRDSCC